MMGRKHFSALPDVFVTSDWDDDNITPLLDIYKQHQQHHPTNTNTNTTPPVSGHFAHTKRSFRPKLFRPLCEVSSPTAYKYETKLLLILIILLPDVARHVSLKNGQTHPEKRQKRTGRSSIHFYLLIITLLHKEAKLICFSYMHFMWTLAVFFLLLELRHNIFHTFYSLHDSLKF